MLSSNKKTLSRDLAWIVGFIVLSGAPSVFAATNMIAKNESADGGTTATEPSKTEGMAPHSLVANIQAKDPVNPFSGETLSLEQLQSQYNVEAMKAQIAQAKYNAARFKQQIQSLDQQASAQQVQRQRGQSDQLQRTLKALDSKISNVSSQVGELKKDRYSQSRTSKPKVTARAKKASKPTLLAVVHDGAGGIKGMVKYKDEIMTVAPGDSIDQWTVANVRSDSAVLSRRGHMTKLALDHQPGHVVTGSSLAMSGEQAGQQNYGGGTGGRPVNVNGRLRQQVRQLTSNAR